MILQQFLVLHDVEDNIQKVYHIPLNQKVEKFVGKKKGASPKIDCRRKYAQ